MFRSSTIRYATLVALLLMAAWWWQSNGLYGQDAHEYLRQCRGFMERLQGLPAPAPTRGDSEFGAGFPLLGALLGLLLGNPIIALQCVTAATALLAAHFFDASNRLLLPGANRWSYGFWCALLVSAPLFMRAAATSMSDMPALCFLLGSVLYAFRFADRHRTLDLAIAAFWAGLAMLTRPAIAAALIPLWIWLGFISVNKRQFVAIFIAILAILPSFAAYHWARAPLLGAPAYSSVIYDWTLWHIFQRSFNTVHGTLGYALPNGLHLLSVLCHWGFFLLLPLIFVLFKKTDLHVPERKVLVACCVCYVLLVAGLPVQSPRYLLPLWGLGLLVLFPAFDRVVSYGLHLIKPVLLAFLGISIAVQLGGWAHYARPIVARQRLERHLASHLAQHVPPDATVYTMDVDIALKNYLPALRMANVWEKEFVEFVPNAYFLFHEDKWKQQWKGQNPMKNLEKALPLLETVHDLGRGWKIGRLVAKH